MGSRDPIGRRLEAHRRIGVDTSTLVYFLSGDERRAAVGEALLASAGEGRTTLVISVITHIELLVGPMMQKRPDATLVVDGLLTRGSGITLVDVDARIGRTAAAIRAEKRLALGEAIIAATAIESGCTALVGNDNAFARLSEHFEYIHIDGESSW